MPITHYAVCPFDLVFSKLKTGMNVALQENELRSSGLRNTAPSPRKSSAGNKLLSFVTQEACFCYRHKLTGLIMGRE